jgi:hypothetical protein
MGQLKPSPRQPTALAALLQLFVSPRTVSHDLRSIFKKLGISSRAELIRLGHASDGTRGAPSTFPGPGIRSDQDRLVSAGP